MVGRRYFFKHSKVRAGTGAAPPSCALPAACLSVAAPGPPRRTSDVLAQTGRECEFLLNTSNIHRRHPRLAGTDRGPFRHLAGRINRAPGRCSARVTLTEWFAGSG